MYSKLLAIKEIKDLSAFAVMVTEAGNMNELTKDIVAHGIIFHKEDFLTEDVILKATSTSVGVTQLLGKLEKEPEHLRALHLIQLLGAYNPGVSAQVDRFLQKSSC